MVRPIASALRRAALPAIAALGLAALLGGCVAYPAYPDYGAYSPGYAYPAGGYVAFGGGWGGHDRDDWHR
jgi:hypothetical protein